MGRTYGKRQPVTSKADETARRENLAAGRRLLKLRFGGRLASAEAVKQALAANVSAYLERIDILARKGADERIALDAARYLIDRVAGKPTEKVQTEQLPVTYQAPSDTQFRELAGRIRGDSARATNGESGADPDSDGVVADSVAETQ